MGLANIFENPSTTPGDPRLLFQWLSAERDLYTHLGSMDPSAVDSRNYLVVTMKRIWRSLPFSQLQAMARTLGIEINDETTFDGAVKCVVVGWAKMLTQHRRTPPYDHGDRVRFKNERILLTTDPEPKYRVLAINADGTARVERVTMHRVNQNQIEKAD